MYNVFDDKNTTATTYSLKLNAMLKEIGQNIKLRNFDILEGARELLIKLTKDIFIDKLLVLSEDSSYKKARAFSENSAPKLYDKLVAIENTVLDKLNKLKSKLIISEPYPRLGYFLHIFKIRPI